VRCNRRETIQTTTHVELLEKDLWTRVQIPPAPPFFSCWLLRVHTALINPHFFKNGDVSIPSQYEKQTPRKIPNEINGLLADFDGKTVAVPDFLNGLYLS